VRIVGGGPLATGAAGQQQQQEQERYCVHLGNIVESLKQRTLHAVIRERYARDDKLGGGDGDRNARICRVLLDKRFLDQQQLSELAMMSLRETRERLYHMYRDEVVTFQEVPRRADHHPNQTFYLWAFDARRVTGELLDRMYKGALNLRLRRQKEVGEKGDLLANKDNIRDEVEAAHFDRLTTALDRLDQALENVDETIMLFTVF
jgi:transcription initiation factor IIE alpha subunit